jgi:ribonuclease HII
MEGERMDEVPSQPEQPALLDAPPPAPCRRCGLDEVGRGALAGPLVAAAVILPDDMPARLGPLARFLRDSKTVPAARRRDLAAAIRIHALALEIVAIDVAAINAQGIGWANREAFRLLIEAVAADEYVVDGKVRPPIPPDVAARVRCFPRADAQVPAVSAASLVAKVYRDDWMARLHGQYPHFGWESNVGYAAPVHLAALKTHGPCPEHRTLFVATALAGGQRAHRANGTKIGRRGKQAREGQAAGKPLLE